MAVLLSKAIVGARRVKLYDLLRSFWSCFECVCESGFVLASYAALLLAVQVQEVAEVFSEVVDCVDGQLDAEVCGVGICDRDLQYGFSASVEFAQKCFAVEQPGVWKLLGRVVHLRLNVARLWWWCPEQQ